MSNVRESKWRFKINREYIRAKLIEQGETQAGFARKCNINQATLSQLMKNEQKRVLIPTLSKLMKGLGLDWNNPDDRAKLIVE